MMKIIAVMAIIAVSNAQYLNWGPVPVQQPLPSPAAVNPLQAAYAAAPVAVAEKPLPYSFGYDTLDDYGTKLTRSETGDGAGAVKGSYGYKDANGVTRIVEYIADAGGFRATVSTNEPGTEKSSPSGVLYNANPIQVPYTPVAKAAVAAVPSLLPAATLPALPVPGNLAYGRFY